MGNNATSWMVIVIILFCMDIIYLFHQHCVIAGGDLKKYYQLNMEYYGYLLLDMMLSWNNTFVLTHKQMYVMIFIIDHLDMDLYIQQTDCVHTNLLPATSDILKYFGYLCLGIITVTWYRFLCHATNPTSYGF